MTEDELENLERELKVALPDQYRDILLNHPFSESPLSNQDLLGCAKDLHDHNLEFRNDGWFGFDWDPSWMVIGIDGCGNCHYITTAPFSGGVHFADHENLVNSPDRLAETRAYESFDEFIEDFREVEREILADEALEGEGIANRKWWQFWIPKKL